MKGSNLKTKKQGQPPEELKMKLSSAQQRIMDKVHGDIDLARSLDFDKWFIKTQCRDSEEQYNRFYKDNPEKKEWARKYYENEKNGIVLTSNVSSTTLYKLQQFGLIEILEDSKGTRIGVDTIKVLNY